MFEFQEGVSDHALEEALAPGTRLLNGQYVIERYLSSGGFGITYMARDSLDRQVVIKECFPESFCSRVNKSVHARSRSHQDDFRAFVDLFVREARRLSKLDHPNVVGVHQVFEDNDTAYMALDLIDGKDLLDIIEDGAPGIGPAEVKGILLKLLDAVSLVHGRDMLHRDISPDNILIDQRGDPVLIDFGAAREEASKKSRVLSSVLVVKDGYSPQEFYISGSQQGPSSDLYALAATFVHLISGEAPPNSQARLAAIAASRPDPYEPLSGRVPGYEPAFLSAIDTAMNVFPGDRIQSARDWILRIDSAARIEDAQARAQDDRELEQTLIALVRSEARAAERLSCAADAPHPAPVKAAPPPVATPVAEDPVPSAAKGPTIAETRKRAMAPASVEREVPDYIQLVRQARAAVELQSAPPPPPLPVVAATEVDYEKLSKYALCALLVCAALFFSLMSNLSPTDFSQSLSPSETGSLRTSAMAG